MHLYSWNVNGIRAVQKKGFSEILKASEADFYCLQETKAHADQVDQSFLDELGYQAVWNSAEKKGYSGTAIFYRTPPVSTHLGMGMEEHDNEGRVITLEYPQFYLVTVYTPNAQDGLRRLPYRQSWDVAFREYVAKLSESKPVVLCGDLNVAHKEIDLARPKANKFNPGFSAEEREGFSNLLNAGFTDTFRHFDDRPEQYSWWSYRGGARARNVGWRIDYFCTSKALDEQLINSSIHQDVMGSDHCPVSLEIDL